MSAVTIRGAQSGRRVEALFKAMSTDFLLREQFVTNPAGLLAEYVGGESLTAEEAAPSNRLIYSVAANADLVRWLRSYALSGAGERTDFLSSFGRATVRTRADHVVMSLARGAVEKSGYPGLFGSLLDAVLGGQIFVQDDGTEVSGTEISTGTGGTGTEVSGTEISTGTGGTGGTEISTGTGGTGTEVSGTEISSGGLEWLFDPIYAPVLIDLMRFAQELATTGALEQVEG